MLLTIARGRVLYAGGPNQQHDETDDTPHDTSSKLGIKVPIYLGTTRAKEREDPRVGLLSPW
jgi:hypothetical protein